MTVSPRITSFLGAVAAAWLLTGCEIVAPGDDLLFEITGERHGLYADPVAQVAAVGSRIIVTGALSTPTPCEEVTAARADADSRIILRVVVTTTPVGCYDVVGRFEYRASLRIPAIGAHEVVVVHTYVGSAWPTDTVAVTPVLVR